MQTAQHFLQDLHSHAIALRQRGCEKLVEFIRQANAYEAKPVLTDELLRKMAALVTDLSPIVSSLSMEFMDNLFQRIPSMDDNVDDEEVRIWMPSLVMIGIIIDGLMCRLADAKVPIRTKSRTALSTISSKIDSTIMLRKLSALSNSRNVHMKRNIVELMIEIVQTHLSEEEVASLQRDIAQTALLFVTDVDHGIQEQAWLLLEAAMRHLGSPFLVLLKDLGARTDVLAKLHAKYQSQKVSEQHQTVAAVTDQLKSSAVASSHNTAESGGINGQNTYVPASLSFVQVSQEGFDLKTLLTFLVDANVISQQSNSQSFLPSTALILRSETEMNTIFERMLVDFTDEEDWQRRLQACITLGNLAWGSLWDMMTPAVLLRKLQDALDMQMSDLRSTITKEICKSLSIMCYQWKQKNISNPTNFPMNGLVSILELLWPKIAKLLVCKTQIMASSADTLARIFLCTCEDAKIIFLIHELMKSKSGVLHKHAMEYLLFCVLRWPADLLDKASGLISTCMKLGLADANADARKVARCIYRWYQNMSMSISQPPANRSLLHYTSFFRRLEGEVEATILRQITSEDKVFLTVEMMQFVQKAPFSLQYFFQSSSSSTTPSSTVIESTTDSVLEPVSSESTAVYVEEEDFDWMGAATGTITTATAKKVPANNTRMSILSSGAMRSTVNTTTATATGTTSNGTASNVSSSMLLMGGARRMSMSATMLRDTTVLDNTTSNTVNNSASTVSAVNRTVSAGGARRMSVMGPPLAPTTTNTAAVDVVTTMPPPVPQNTTTATTTSSASVSISGEANVVISTSSFLNNLTNVHNMAALNRRVSTLIPPPSSNPTTSNTNIGNSSSSSSGVGLREGPKRVLQPVAVPSPLPTTNVNASNNSSLSVGPQEENTDPATTSASRELQKSANPLISATMKKVAATTSIHSTSTVSLSETFKAALQQAISSSTSNNSVYKLKVLDLYYQNLKHVSEDDDNTTTTTTTTSRNDHDNTMIIAQQRDDIVNAGWSYVLDSTADANAKVYTEAIKNLDFFFSQPGLVYKYLAVHTDQTSNNPTSTATNSHSISNQYKTSSMVSILLVKLFTCLVDAKPAAREAISRITNDLRALLSHESLLKIMIFRLKDLPERALAAAFQFAGALLPATSTNTATNNAVGEAAKRPAFIADIVLRTMNCLVPGSYTDSTSTASASINSSNSEGDNNSKKPSPVAMLAGKRFLAKFYETVMVANNETVTTATKTAVNVDSVFFKVVTSMTIAQQTTLKSLLITALPAQQFDVKLAAQLKRDKQMLLKKYQQQQQTSGTNGSGNSAVQSTNNATVLANIAAALTKNTTASTKNVDLLEQKEELLEAVVQQVCRSPSTIGSLTTTAISSVTKSTTPNTTTDNTIRSTSSKKSSPISATTTMTTMMLSPLAMVTSPMMMIATTNMGQEAGEEIAEHVITLLRSVQKASTHNSKSASPVTDYSSSNTEEQTLCAQELFPEETGVASTTTLRTVSISSVKEKLLSLTGIILTGGESDSIRSEYEECLAQLSELMVHEALSTVTCMEFMVLLLDLYYPLSVIFNTNTNNGTIFNSMRSVFLALITMGQVFSSDMMTTLVEKVYQLLAMHTSNGNNNTMMVLSEYETVLTDIIVCMVNTTSTTDSSTSYLPIVQFAYNQIVDNATNNSMVVFTLKLWSSILVVSRNTNCSTNNVDNEWDSMWSKIVNWILVSSATPNNSSANSIIAHPVTLVRQQATICVAQLFLFYNTNTKIVGKERREQCLQWMMPLSVVQRKLLMVYVEKFRSISN